MPGGSVPVASPFERSSQYYDYTAPHGAEEDGFDPLKLLWYVIHYRWLIGAFMIAGLVAGAMYTFMQTPLYRASARLEIVTTGPKVLQDFQVVSQSTDWRAYETARLKLLNGALARRVVYELNLTDDEKFLAPAPRFSLSNIVRRAIGSSSRANLDDLSAEQREAMAVGKVLGGLSAELIRDSALMSVSYSHPDPYYAALVVNQVVRSYIDQDVDKASETSDLAREFIQQQVRETKEKLQASEEALVDYANQQGITVTGDDASLIAQNIAQLNDALAGAIQERVKAERYYDQVKEGNSSTLPEVFENASIQSAKGKIAELKATYQQKRTKLKPGFPEMQQLQRQISELQKQVDEQIADVGKSVELQYEQAKDTEQAIKKELATLEREQREFQDKYIQYTILKRDVDSNRAQYESLIAKLGDVGVGSQLRTTNASIVDLAFPPGAPYTPRLSRNVLFALLFFGAMAAALIYLLELMNNTFSVPDQIDSELHIPVLGVLPTAPATGLMEAFEDNKSALSEAYRTLRTSLQFTGAENTMRILLVTSSEQGEGKSTTAYKLAHDFAALGRRVLIIDADLRRPQLHRMFKSTNAIGLSNLLSNVVPGREVISVFNKTKDERVTLLPSGTIPPNPVELLSSHRMGILLHHCAKAFDLVIIDGPPIMGLSDAAVLARLADATLMVVAANQTSRKAAKTALSRMKTVGANVVGAALTKFSINKLDYNYAYRYMHYDYYQYYDSPQIEDHAENTSANSPLANNFSSVVSYLRDRVRRLAA